MKDLTVAGTLILLVILCPFAMSQSPDKASKRQESETAASTQIPWCGSYLDALTIAKERNVPILVCFNMDGEEANDHAAKVIYKDAEFVKLCESFACVIGSIDKHKEQEAEVGGLKKSVCSRFGFVNCAEHQQSEIKARTALIGKSENIAPQHLILAPDGRILERRAYHLDRKQLMALMQRALRNCGILAGGAASSPQDLAAEKQKIAAMLQDAERAGFSMLKVQPTQEIYDLGTPQSRDALLHYLKKGDDDEVKVAITQVFGQSGDYLAFEPLRAATKDSSTYVALAAVDALGKLRLPGALKELKSLLGRYPEGNDHGRVLRAYAACGFNEETVRDHVIKKAKGGDQVIRGHALVALHSFKPDQEITGVLISSLRDQSNLVKAAAVYAAGMSFNESCREPLERLIEETTNADMKDLVKSALQHLEHKEVLEGDDACGLRWKLEPFLPLGDTRRF